MDAGVVGRSARQEHERHAAKREAAVKERWGDRIGGVVLALTDEPRVSRPCRRSPASYQRQRPEAAPSRADPSGGAAPRGTG